MELKSFFEIIRSHSEFLINEGYEFREVERNIWYTKALENVGFRIAFDFTVYRNSIHVKSLRALKRFNELEMMLRPVFGGEVPDAFSIYKVPEETDINQGLKYSLSGNIFHFEINQAKELELFMHSVRSFCLNTAFPFFEANESLEHVYSQIRNMPQGTLSNYIINDGNAVFYRVFLVKSFFNPAEGEEYFNQVISELDKLKGNSTFERMAKNMHLLKLAVSERA